MKKLIFAIFAVALISCGGDDNSHDIGIINGTLTSVKSEAPIMVEIDATNEITLRATVLKAMEYAYFEGQKDYAEDDVRIGKTEIGEWEWTKSCWD